MKKKNRSVAVSLIPFSILISIFSYAVIRVLDKAEEWFFDQSSIFDPRQTIVDTFKLHWRSFILWNVIFVISIIIVANLFRKFTANEKKLRHVLNSTIDGIILIDDQSIILDVNPATEKLFGYKTSELIGQNVSVLMPKPYKDEHDGYIQNYINSGKAKVIGIDRETVGIRKDGTIFQINLSVSEVNYDKRKLFTGIVRDITSRKQLEMKLEIQYLHQTALLDFDFSMNQIGNLNNLLNRMAKAIRDCLSPGDGVCILVWNDGEIKPHIISTDMGSAEKNEAVKPILADIKHYRGEVIAKGKPVYMGEIKSKNLPFHKLLLEKHINSYVEIPLCTSDNILGVIYIFGDVKKIFDREDKKFLQALAIRATAFIEKANLFDRLRFINHLLQSQKAELQALLDSTGGAIALISPEMQFVTINQNFAKLFNIPNNNITSYSLQDFLVQIKLIFEHPDTLISRIYDALDNSVEKISDTFIQNVPARRELGLFSRAVHAADGGYLGRLFVFRDVTQEREVKRMKSEFVSLVSHELRTPLTSIHGSLGLIHSGVTGEISDQTKALVEIAYKNSERLVRLINDILDLEKIESGRLIFENSVIDLVPLVNQAVQLNIPYANQYKVKLKVLNTIPSGKVFADTDRIIQILTNLLSNAVKFSPIEKPVTIDVFRKGRSITVAVTNHGPSISTEFRKRIFEPFAQGDSSTTRTKGGTGLGLNISKEIIEKMNGKIGYHSQAKTGTTFYISLPEWKGKTSEDQK